LLDKKVSKLPAKGVKGPGSLELAEITRLMQEDIERYRLFRKRGGPSGGQKVSKSTGNSSSKSTGTLKAYKVGSGAWETLDSATQKSLLKDMEKFYGNMGLLSPLQPIVGQKQTGGVMTDQTQLLPGRRVIVTTATSGSPPVTNTSTLVQSVTAWDKILDNVASVDGNRRNPNPHRFRVRKTDRGGGVTWAGDSRNNTTISGNQALALPLFASFVDLKNFTYNKVLSKMYEQIRGDTDLSVDAFQARQSGVMLNQRFKQGREVFLSKAPKGILAIADLVRRMKRSNPRDWGSIRLEWVYGWKPLAKDIYGAAENMILASAKSSSGISGHPVRVNGSETSDWRVTRSENQPGVYTITEIEKIFQCRITGFYALTTGGLNSVAGYTSLNPVSIAWELVPYSFVADWFVDVGGYLRNMESSLLYNSDFTGGYSTERSKETIRQSVTGGNLSYSASVKGSYEGKEFQRKVLVSSPSPRPPSFNPKLGTERLINAAALLSQMLHSLKRKL
jgi:hypothetical protein